MNLNEGFGMKHTLPLTLEAYSMGERDYQTFDVSKPNSCCNPMGDVVSHILASSVYQHLAHEKAISNGSSVHAQVRN